MLFELTKTADFYEVAIYYLLKRMSLLHFGIVFHLIEEESYVVMSLVNMGRIF